MKRFSKNVFYFFILLLFSCNTSAEDEEMEFWCPVQHPELLMEEELTCHRKLEAVSQTGHSVSDMLFHDNNYFVYFDNGESVYFSKSRTPIFTINSEGRWCINDVPTAVPHKSEAGVPYCLVGRNGNWWIDGVDSGVRGPWGIFPIVRYVVDLKSQMVFCCSDILSYIIPKKEQTPFFKNNPLPVNPDTLRVLALGNSYSLDATAYLYKFQRLAIADFKRVGVYAICHAGASLEYWCSQYLSTEQHKLLHMAGSVNMKNEGRLRDLLAQPWDVVILQQNSANALDYKTYTPYLRYLIGKVKENVKNDKVALAWQMVWSYWSGFGGAPYGNDRYQHIVSATQQMMKNEGIDIVIPIGTAIENARNTELQTPHDLTRDGTHIAHGVGRYIAVCTWYESILAPVFGKTMLGNSLLYTLTEKDKATSKYESADVTEENRSLCQRCAYAACQDHFHVTPLGEMLRESAAEGIRNQNSK